MLFPASKLGDLIIGVDAHTITLPPPAPPIPLTPHPFIGYIFLWWSPNFPSYNVFVNGMPALTLGAKSISAHFPMPPGIWWIKLPCPAKFFITHYTTVLLSTLFSVVLNTVGSMTGTTVPTTRTPDSQMDPPPENPLIWAALSAQIKGFSWMSILRMLLPPVVLPISEGDVNMASPTVTVNGGPMSFVGPLFSGSCSEIPIIPNSNILGFSNVMVGVTLKEILMQLAWNVVHGVANVAASKLGAKFGTWVSGEPVDMVSGAVWVKQTDFTVPGPIPVEFTRSYINCVNEFGPLGYNWTHTYNQFLRIENEAIFYYNDEGRPVRMPLLAVGSTYRNNPESSQFEHPDKDTYVLHTKSRQTLIFRLTTLEPIARLMEILDRSGNQIRLEYTGTRLVRLIDSVDRRFGFSYDPLGRLTGVRFKGQGRAIADSPLVSFEYDLQGDLAAVFDAADHARRFGYNQYHWLTRHTDRNGFSVHYKYDEVGQCVKTWADGDKYGGTAEYLTAARITRWTNFRNHTWTYFYNDQNLVTQIVDPLGYSRRLAWSTQGKLLSATDQAGFTTSYEYDERGGCTRRTDAAGNVFTQVFSEQGDVIEYTDAEGTTIHHEYDDAGRLTAFVDELGARWEHSYQERGLMHEFTSPDGMLRRSQYSADWSSLELSDQAGVYSRKRFDALGNLVGSEDHRGAKFQYWNTPQGWVEQIIGPAGVVGQYTYDGEGNPKSFTDADGAMSHFSFEGLHRPTLAQDPSHEPQFCSYEPVDEKIAALKDAAGQRVAFEYDACERLSRQEFFDGRWAECAYDGRGLLTKLTFSSGLLFEFTYDVLGRTIRWEASDGTFAAYKYDRIGRCIRGENGSGILEFTYDPASRLIREQQGAVTIDFEYDVHGNVVRRTNSLTGRRVSLEYANGSQISAIRDQQGGFQEILREGAQRRTTRRFSNGVEETIYHTIYGEVQSQVVRSRGSVLAERQYTHDKLGRIVGLRDNWRGDRTFEYDGARRLIAFDRDGQTEENFSYDRNDNLQFSSLQGEFTYSSGNRIERAGQVSFSHDKNGNVTSITNAVGALELRSDALGRLTHSFDSSGTQTEYGYDALGRRAFKRTGGRETRFYWHDYALMLEDHDGDPPLEYVIMPGTSVPFMMWHGSELHHHIVDHLGTVQEMLGPDGRFSWQGLLAPWGELLRTSVARVENNLRFLGQYADQETGLHYNVNRYYDPHRGRYLSPDPAGLAAGLNQYQYALNPIDCTDPFGLGRVPASPNAEIHRADDNGDFGTKCPSCGANLHGPGGQKASSPDHIEPFSSIEKMPGYDALSPENKGRIQNQTDDFVSLCQPCNQSRGNKPYGNGEGEWSGRDGAPMNPRILADLKRRQAQLKSDLPERIQDMLDEQAEEEAAARRGRGGCG
jgi:RHS repeat-associated protein